MTESARPSMPDRRIHAEAGEWRLVRYDRAGKWYVEYEPDRLRPARHVGVRSAASLAVRMERDYAGHIYLGLPGGRRFDRLVEIERGLCLHRTSRV